MHTLMPLLVLATLPWESVWLREPVEPPAPSPSPRIAAKFDDSALVRRLIDAPEAPRLPPSPPASRGAAAPTPPSSRPAAAGGGWRVAGGGLIPSDPATRHTPPATRQAPTWHPAIVNGQIQQVWGYAAHGVIYPAIPPAPAQPMVAPQPMYFMPSGGGGCPGGQCRRR